MRAVGLFLAAAVLSSCTAPTGRVTLQGRGGDAWTFTKPLVASVEGPCAEVVFASPRGTVAARPRQGRAWARVPLDAGPNRVTASCRGGGATAVQDWTLRLADTPTAEIRLVPDPAGIMLDAGASRSAAGRPAPLLRFDWQGWPGLVAQGLRVPVPAPGEDGDHVVHLTVTDALGRSDSAAALLRVADGRAQPVDPWRGRAAWIDRAVVYGVVPSLFGPHGLADVTRRLPQLAALGVTVLWLSPVTAAPEGDFGYAVSDLFRLRPDLGSEADLQQLVTTAHGLGLRVILDFVANHLADRHPYAEDRTARGAASPYLDFFAGGERDHYFDWVNLKNLEYDNPEVQAMMIAAFAHWVRRFDIDGFRVDAAWGPRQRAPEFWPRWRAALTRIKPDLLLLAEAPVRDPYYGQAGFSAAYDWTAELGHWAWQPAFEQPDRTAALLREAIAASLAPADDAAAPLVFRFLNNNDTGARFVSRYGVARTRVAAALLLTLPGLPALYTGDEVGAAYLPYDEGPPIGWTDPSGLGPWYRTLITLRAAWPALRGPALHFVDAGHPETLLAFVRGVGAQRLLVLLNFAEAPVRIQAARLPALSRDLLAGRPLEAGAIEVPAEGVRILALR
jgi:glycosidase